MATTQPQSRSQRLRRWAKSEGRSLLLVLVLLTVARTSFANHYAVPSSSMEPTLLPGDRVVVDMTAYGLRVPFTEVTLVGRSGPRRGEVVIFKSPKDGTRLIKRVVAVAGDAVSLTKGRLTINGNAMSVPGMRDVERFGARVARLDLDAGGGPDIGLAIIPDGKVLVLGDHRGDSLDGRYFGLVDADALYARAMAVYYRRGAGLVWKRL